VQRTSNRGLNVVPGREDWTGPHGGTDRTLRFWGIGKSDRERLRTDVRITELLGNRPPVNEGAPTHTMGQHKGSVVHQGPTTGVRHEQWGKRRERFKGEMRL